LSLLLYFAIFFLSSTAPKNKNRTPKQNGCSIAPMVAFGHRLNTELANPALWDAYIPYNRLKKIIKEIVEHETKGEMVPAYEGQERFTRELQESIASANDFFASRATALVEVESENVQRIVLDVLAPPPSSDAPAPAPAAKTKGSHSNSLPPDDEAAIRAVGDCITEANELRRFCLVNREAVRKLLKKNVKKTSGHGRDFDEASGLGALLEGTAFTFALHPLAASLAKLCVELGFHQVQLGLKSMAHAKLVEDLQELARTALAERAAGSPGGALRRRDSFVGGVDLVTGTPVTGTLQRRASFAELVADTIEETAAKAAEEHSMGCLCGIVLKWQVRLSLAEWWSDPRRRLTNLLIYAFVAVVVASMIMVVAVQPDRLAVLIVLGVYASVLVALANGANDIANSMGTSFGAGALTMTQAIVLGLIAEALGAMSLGSLVAKTISKGIVDPSNYAAAGCIGVLRFGVSMVCVLVGTGIVTLLATLYGLPISASHGVIGGLIAVGLIGQGPESLGVASIIKTMVAWVASPTVGAVSSALINTLIVYAIHRSNDPGARARLLQPCFIALVVAVAVGFIAIKGPPALKISPAPVGAGVSVLIGVGVGVLIAFFRVLKAVHARRKGGGDEVGTSSASSESAPVKAASSGVVLADGGGGGGGGSESDAALEEARRHMPTSPGMREAAKLEGAEKPFVPLLILSALTVAFAHGANDVGNAVGPLAAILEAAASNIEATPEVPIWVLAIGSGGFVVGIAALGNRTISTVGGKITKLTPSRSFSVQIGAAVAVLSSTVLGLAVSTSHCLVGSVIGIGIAGKLTNSGGQLNMRILIKILIGWAVTIPLSMIVTIIMYLIVMPHYGYDDLLTIPSLNGTNETCF
jgi:phosphate/sulfate permease